MVTNCITSAVFGFVIFLYYGFKHTTGHYSLRYNLELFFMTILVAFIVSIVGANNYYFLGAIGILSLLGYFMASINNDDGKYIFYSVLVGICCGISEYYYVGTAFVLMIVVYILQRVFSEKEQYRVHIRADVDSEEEISRRLGETFCGQARLLENKVVEKQCDMVYKVPKRFGYKTIDDGAFLNDMYNIKSVSLVNIIDDNNNY